MTKLYLTILLFVSLSWIPFGGIMDDPDPVTMCRPTDTGCIIVDDGAPI